MKWRTSEVARRADEKILGITKKPYFLRCTRVVYVQGAYMLSYTQFVCVQGVYMLIYTQADSVLGCVRVSKSMET
jgi:hypothetical protein